MKFVSLNSARTTGPAQIAVRTDVPVDREVFAHMKTLASQLGISVWIDTTPDGLVTVESSVRPQVCITGAILQDLEELYQAAEQFVAHPDDGPGDMGDPITIRLDQLPMLAYPFGPAHRRPT